MERLPHVAPEPLYETGLDLHVLGHRWHNTPSERMAAASRPSAGRKDEDPFRKEETALTVGREESERLGGPAQVSRSVSGVRRSPNGTTSRDADAVLDGQLVCGEVCHGRCMGSQPVRWSGEAAALR